MITKPVSFARGMENIPQSFIREILKVSTKPDMISFAGGLPNPDFFPAEKIAVATEKVMRLDGKNALQYAPSEGYLPLRDYIAQRQSQKDGKHVSAEQVLMLHGSQQGLDLCGKLLINPGDNVLMEGPSYLGAIQAFSAYQPNFCECKIMEGGPDVNEFHEILANKKPTLFYCVPNFQNPTGNVYTLDRREKIVSALHGTDTMLIEDNPYSDIYFESQRFPDFHALCPERTVCLGSFSKIISPGLRLGWAVGPGEVIKKMTIAKQASDLHSSNFVQRVVFQFLSDNSLEDHLSGIRNFYASQANYMAQMMQIHFPSCVHWTKPTGGMFMWITMPPTVDAYKMLDNAVKQHVLYVPGQCFYVDGQSGKNTARVNFSNPSSANMEKGIRILGSIIREEISIS